ncbi:hypothetical protein LTR84_011632 [Exophiala bonariae]|uniref:Uncharacterized protein n=1 Tax=Exophiala bonariae TaxID=1690606 RepID=A0AAV9NK80_9EURO|nr:hypothetical protein LTR84_011632 [Exophiala bonariae]
MCRYTLHICPYPDHDPIAALIFNPAKAGLWEHCDKPKPWGKLSCGNLSIVHPTNMTSSTVWLSPPPVLAPRDNNVGSIGNEKHTAATKSVDHTAIEITEITPNDEEVILDDEPCVLCSTVLKLVSTKSKELQEIARQALVEFESIMNKNLELRKMQETINVKAAEMESMRHETWKMAHALLSQQDGNMDEKS